MAPVLAFLAAFPRGTVYNVGRIIRTGAFAWTSRTRLDESSYDGINELP